MKQTNYKRKTYEELQELSKFLNRVHRILWTVLAGAVAIGAIFNNPGHLLTAALLLLFSRAEWTPSDLNAIQ